MSTCCDTSADRSSSNATLTIALAGNPNCGKTTIFNLIGPGYSLVTVDGRSTNCAAPPIGI